jgi:hypothetical protein
MTPQLIILLFLLLETKHFVFDFLLQPPYMFLNKGTFLHPGGILHSYFHALATVFILVGFAGTSVLLLALLEFVIHYATDYAKVNINRHFSWDANKHPQFWYLTGADQLVHHLTYCLLLWLCL